MSGPGYTYLPGILAEIADAAGLPSALLVAEAKGGIRAHFPAQARAGHWLTKLVGQAAADKICAHFRTGNRAGFYALVPLGPKNFHQKARRSAEDLTRNGVPREEVAARLGIHMRTVQRARARMRDVEHPAQLKLL